MKTILLLLAIAGSTLFSNIQSFAQCSGPINYSNDSTGGTFDDPVDWSGLVAPSSLDQCVVKNGYPMSLGTSYSLSGTNCLVIEAGTSLVLNAGSALNFSGGYTIINDGTISGDGVLNIGSGCTLVNNGTVSSELVNSGTISGTGTINVASGKTLTISNTSNNFIGNEIYNYGTINILSSVTIDSLTYNYGSITVGNNAILTYKGYMYGSGTILINNGASVLNNGIMNGVTNITVNSGSSFNNRPGGEILWLYGTIASLNVTGPGASFTNEGYIGLNRDINVTSSGLFTNTGIISLIGNIQLNTGTITNSGTMNLSGAWTIAGSSITNSGTLNTGPVSIAASTVSQTGTINTTGDFTLSSLSTPFVNEGTLSVTGQIPVNSNISFINQSTGVITGGLAGAAITVSGANAVFTNYGSMTGTRDLKILSAGTVNNTGTTFLTGLLQLTSATLTNSGTLGLSGTWTVAGNSTLTNSGTLNTGPVSIAASTVSQTGTINTTGDFTLSSLAAPFVNSGTLSVTGQIPVNSNISLINQPSGVISGGLAGAGLTVSGTNAMFTNYGSMTGIRNLTITSAGMVNNIGTTTLTGALQLSSATLTNSGTLGLSGTWTVSGNSSLTNSGTLNTGTVSISASTVAHTGTINTTGDFSLSSLSAPFVNPSTISVTGNLAVNSNAQFVNQASGIINGGSATARLTVSGTNALFTNYGALTGTRDLYLTSTGTFVNHAPVTLTGLVNMNASAVLTNYSTLGLNKTWNISNNSLINNYGTLNTGAVTVASSNINLTTGSTFNCSAEFALNTGPCQLNISSGATLNAASMRVNSGSFNNYGLIATTGNFTNNSSSTVWNYANIQVQGNFENTTDFRNNGPVALGSGNGIIIQGDFKNSGAYVGTDGYTQVAQYSRNMNNGTMTGTQIFCDLGNPPGGIDRNQGIITVGVLGCKGIAPLPVTLVSFEGKIKEGAAYLTWTTSFEKNSDKFIIEKSGSGVEWKEVGTVKSVGNSTTLQHYDFRDASGLNGTTYYRLKQVDFDGTSQYSKIISLSGKLLPAIEVYPNPATANFTIKAPVEVLNASVELVNSTGAVVYRKEIGAIKSNETLDINFENQKPTSGLYLVRIVSDGKAVITPQSIIIN